MEYLTTAFKGGMIYKLITLRESIHWLESADKVVNISLLQSQGDITRFTSFKGQDNK